MQGVPAIADVPALQGADGAFPDSPARAGLRYFFDPAARRALGDEIRAQFEAFRASGLALDHVDGHTHLHIHPTIFSLLLRIGPGYGMRAMRVPYERPLASWRAAGQGAALRFAAAAALRPWAAIMRARLAHAGIVANDATAGLFDSGAMTEERVLRHLEQVRARGITEFYFHPATERSEYLEANMPGYRNVEEFEALVSPRVRAALQRLDIVPASFREL